MRVEFMDDTTRSIIRNVKGPGMCITTWARNHMTGPDARVTRELWLTFVSAPTVKEDDILCLLESEREARRLR